MVNVALSVSAGHWDPVRSTSEHSDVAERHHSRTSFGSPLRRLPPPANRFPGRKPQGALDD